MANLVEMPKDLNLGTPNNHFMEEGPEEYLEALYKLTRDGRSVRTTELAKYLDTDRDVVVECLVSAEAYNLRSLDAPIGDEGGRPRMVADVVGQNDERLEHVTNREALRPLLAALPQRDRDVLEMRFFESMTQSQIAEKIGTSQMQVSRILSRILGELREQLR